MNLQPDGAAARCRQAAASLETDNAVTRIWGGDGTFWKSEAVARKRIEGALGWLTIPDRIHSTLPEIADFVSEVRPSTDRVLVLGTGGLTLAPRVFSETFAPAPGFPQVEILDSTEPSAVEVAAARSDPSRTIFVVSSKSGANLEPRILFDYFFDHATGELGARAGERFVVITDPGSALEKEAAARRVRKIFPGDPRIGARYSALSSFGLVPAAFLGVDMPELIGRARKMADACRAPGFENPGLLLGAALGAEALAGRNKLTFSMGESVGRFGMWLEQLIAESTGKDGKGILPVEREAPGGPEAYGQDRFFVRYDAAGREDVAQASRIATLAEHGHAAASFLLRDRLDLAAEMFRWEFATAVAGKIIGIDPFDQPDTRDARDRANAILAGSLSRPAAADASGIDEAALAGLIASIRPGGYFAMTAYLNETPETETALQAIRLKVRNARRVATTLGYGPRCQYATGQIHQGGPAGGVYLQITGEPATEVEIPGRPWGFSGVLAAQADGELASLESHGRRALRVRLPKDTARGLSDLSGAVERGLRA